jgi:hypothetical protein
MRRTSYLPASLLLVASLLGCAGGELEPMSAEESALNGAIDFGSPSTCNASRRLRIQEAAGIALGQVAGSNRSAMLRCLNEAGLSRHSDGFPEEILAQMSEDKITHVKCLDISGNGSAPPGSATETLTLDTAFVDAACAVGGNCWPENVDVHRIASVLLHEVSHNKGYRHPNLSAHGPADEYQYSVPEQIEKCSLSISAGRHFVGGRAPVPLPNGGVRQAAENRVELHRVGRDGGQPFGIDSCQPAGFARGLGLRSEARIDQLSLRCVDDDGLGGVISTPARGGTGGNPGNSDCPAGSLMVGVHGRAGAGIDALGAVCATSAQIAAGSASTSPQVQKGGSGGLPFERLCPTGMAVKAVAGRSATRVDQLSFICQDVSNGTNPALAFAATAGVPAGLRFHERCPTGALVGLFGQSGTVIDRIGGMCREVVRSDSSVDLGATDIYPLSGHGGLGGENWAGDTCPTGSALIGLRYRAGSRIDQVTGVCQNVAARAAGLPASELSLPTRGGGGGIPGTAFCAARKFVVGWDISESDGRVNSIRPLCSDF